MDEIMEKSIEDMTDEEYALFLDAYIENEKALQNITIRDIIFGG